MIPIMTTELNGGGIGTIYVLANKNKTWSKIGRTVSSTAAGRAQSYGKVHGHQWSVFTQLLTMRVSEVETNIHNKIFSWRVETQTRAREIFKISPAQAEALARSMILEPGGNSVAQRTAIIDHVARVRVRLHAQEDYLRVRSSRSTIGGSSVVETDIYPQYVALDALERGITVDEMLGVYRTMWTKREIEVADMQVQSALLYQKAAVAWRATSLFSKLANMYVSPQPTDPEFKLVKINEKIFPAPPRYASELLRIEENRAKSEAKRAFTKGT